MQYYKKNLHVRVHQDNSQTLDSFVKDSLQNIRYICEGKDNRDASTGWDVPIFCKQFPKESAPALVLITQFVSTITIKWKTWKEKPIFTNYIFIIILFIIYLLLLFNQYKMWFHPFDTGTYTMKRNWITCRSFLSCSLSNASHSSSWKWVMIRQKKNCSNYTSIIIWFLQNLSYFLILLTITTCN